MRLLNEQIMECLKDFNVIRLYRKITERCNVVNQESGETPALTQRTEGYPNKYRAFNAIILLVLSALGISNIVIGAYHVNDYVNQELLPIILIVFGGLLIVARLINCVCHYRSVCKDSARKNDKTLDSLIDPNILLVLADAVAVITLSFLTYSITLTTKLDDRLRTNYCNHHLLNNIWYLSLVGLIIFGVPVLCICYVATAKKDE